MRKRAHAEQSARRHLERGDKHAGIMHTRGHRVDCGVKPRLAPKFRVWLVVLSV